MARTRKTPGPVIGAAVITLILALLYGGVSAVAFVEGDQDLGIIGLIFGALLLLLTWRLWQGGGRGAQLGGIVVGVALIVIGVVQTSSVVGLAIFAAFGLTLILLLTVPASARAHFRERQPVQPVPGH